MNTITDSQFLMNTDFLNKIAEQREHDIYANITALNYNEQPIDQIQGKITAGSINIDGDSNIRRTCSLTLISENININDFYWGIKTKFKLDIGLHNHLIGEYSVANGYPEIVWFPQGYYVISSFNTSISTNSATISIQGKDKMCLLNGDLSGQLTSQVDFGTEEIIVEEMIPVTIDKKQFDNSNKLIQAYQNKYYIKEVNKSRVYKSEAVDVNNYPKYIFIKNAENGDFYTTDKNVFLMTTKDKNNEIIDIPTNGIRYDIYKLIDNPGELFQEYVQKNTQEKKGKENETYHIENDTDAYFKLDTTESDITQFNKYYTLTDIYERNININKVKIPVDKIIREAVHAYAQEPYQNIIINDLAQYGLEKMTYKGDATIYILYNTATEEDEQIFFSSNAPNSLKTLVSAWNNEDNFYNFQTGSGKNIYINNGDYTEKNNGTVPYKVKKYSYGDDIGYQLTDLTYAGDLICNEGEALTAMLDKIKTMLGEFEYFYNEEGKFVFQKKKNYLQTSWTQLTNNEQGEPYIDFEKNKITFDFKQNQLLSSISNSPVLNNVHNDITVWGKRKGISGADIAIHGRYAIDKKPEYYKTLQGKVYYTQEYSKNHQISNNGDNYLLVDWRELIYQMALDYFAAQGCSKNNPLLIEDGQMTHPEDMLYEIGRRNSTYFPTGRTGYEQYYTDLQGFWRQLYNPDYIPAILYTSGSYDKDKKWSAGEKQYTFEYYFDKSKIDEDDFIESPDYETFALTEGDEKLYWNRAVYLEPETLDFWFDFIDCDEYADLVKFSIPQIGDRNKVVKEDKASSIIFKDAPNIVFYSNEEKPDEEKQKIANTVSGYSSINLPSDHLQYFTISTKSLSVKDKLDELLYQYSYCTENISISSIPIYHLQPNTRILIQDDKTGIDGEYIIHKLTIPLTYNGMMSISASKAPERLY